MPCVAGLGGHVLSSRWPVMKKTFPSLQVWAFVCVLFFITFVGFC